MELKPGRALPPSPNADGSNRTFMELKHHKEAFLQTMKRRSNRTFMELKQNKLAKYWER